VSGQSAAGRIQVDVRYDCANSTLMQQLVAAGFTPGASVRLSPFCTVEGWISSSALKQVATLAGVRQVVAPRLTLPRLPPAAPVLRTAGSGLRVNSQVAYAGIDGTGASIMRADQFVAQTGDGGAGVTVGVQSAGVASLSVIQGRGELPSVKVVGANGASLPGDEGTALLEEIHAVAPDAGLAFCDSTTYVEYLSCLGSLIDAGATILVDDLDFEPDDLMSSGTDAQMVTQLLAQNPNVLMLTAGGNSNGSYWEGNYAPVSTAAAGLAPLSCNAQSDAYLETFDGTAVQHLTVLASSEIPIVLAWADPAGKNTSNFDLYWSSASGEQSGCFAASSGTGSILVETLPLFAGTYTLRIGTPDASLSGKLLKLWIGGDGLTMISTPTSGSATAPQTFAAGVVTVGAVNGSDGIGNGIESFSSVGPLTVMFPAFQQLQLPTLVAPDGVRVDAAGTDFQNYLFPDGNFYGTSASAPNAAAIAALLRSAFPRLSPPQVLAALEGGATVLGSGRPNATFGFGRVDALGALATFAAPTITPLPDLAANAGASSQPVAFAISGTGDIHFTVTSSDPAVIPGSIVAAGMPGVTVTPAGCGTSALSCGLLVTPAYGGTSTLTLSAVDGANRSASATLHLLATGAPPPPPPPPPPAPAPTPTPAPASASASGGSSGGGGLGWLELTLLCGWASYRAFSSAVAERQSGSGHGCPDKPRARLG
jgi:hypothetical protein